jgi:hypothetical protein
MAGNVSTGCPPGSAMQSWLTRPTSGCRVHGISSRVLCWCRRRIAGVHLSPIAPASGAPQSRSVAAAPAAAAWLAASVGRKPDTSPWAYAPKEGPDASQDNMCSFLSIMQMCGKLCTGSMIVQGRKQTLSADRADSSASCDGDM